MRTIILNKCYITTSGKEFTPIEKLTSERESMKYFGSVSNIFTNKETKFKDAKGNIIKKSKLWFIKGETPPKKPTSTI